MSVVFVSRDVSVDAIWIEAMRTFGVPTLCLPLRTVESDDAYADACLAAILHIGAIGKTLTEPDVLGRLRNIDHPRFRRVVDRLGGER